MQRKNLSSPDEMKRFEKGKMETVTIGGLRLTRITYQPGWKWSTTVKQFAKTDSCQVHHVGYVISGSIEGILDDGTKYKFGPGDSYNVPPGHDGWVVGSEPVVMLNIEGIQASGLRETEIKIEGGKRLLGQIEVIEPKIS